jgi:predicted O-methyltransferase YrrM
LYYAPINTVLHFIRWRLGLEPPQALTTDGEVACLERHAEGKKRLAEIGVWEGVTTCRLRRVMASDACLYAVDPYFKGRLGFSTHRAIATDEVSQVGNGTVVWVRETAVSAARNASAIGREPFDFVFLDALHTYEGLRDEWESWSPLVAPGGVIAIHDSRASGKNSDDSGSVRYTNEAVLPDRRFDVIDTVDSLTVLQRRP